MAESKDFSSLPLEEQFKTALGFIQGADSKNGPKLSNESKLKFYALFKQISKGPNKDKQPSRLQVVQRAKWAAWNELGNMSKEDAMKKYVQTLLDTDPRFRSQLQVTIRSKL